MIRRTLLTLLAAAVLIGAGGGVASAGTNVSPILEGNGYNTTTSNHYGPSHSVAEAQAKLEAGDGDPNANYGPGNSYCTFQLNPDRISCVRDLNQAPEPDLSQPHQQGFSWGSTIWLGMLLGL